MNAVGPYEHSDRQIALIKKTVAKDTNQDEFNLFVEVARGKGLDPFLGQIIPMVFSKDKPDRRKMTIIISRDGQRVIAQRCGDYRPASRPPQYEMDASLKSPANPLGIVSATVYLWKQDPRDGTWYEVAGQSFWDEFAPLKEVCAAGYEWVETGETWDNGKPKKRKQPKGDVSHVLDDSGNWAKMPRLMIAKCAEMQALRAGWPSQFAGLYDEAEMDKAKVSDMDASEVAAQADEAERMRRIGAADSITMTWGDGWALENVPAGQFADRAMEFVAESDPATVDKWQQANRVGLNQFWAKAPGDALAVKKAIEAKVAQQKSEPVKETAAA
jgi:phage recombination protein Bet